MRSVSEATQNFYRVTSGRSVQIVPDTPAKRREYEEEVIRTFYLSNADLKETMDLLRLVLAARRVSPTRATHPVTVKDPLSVALSVIVIVPTVPTLAAPMLVPVAESSVPPTTVSALTPSLAPSVSVK